MLDESAHELMDEFGKFYAKEKLLHPEFTKSEIFEPWAIQRISNLQVAVHEVCERLNHLDRKLAKDFAPR